MTDINHKGHEADKEFHIIVQTFLVIFVYFVVKERAR
jgi:hypothetical protein